MNEQEIIEKLKPRLMGVIARVLEHAKTIPHEIHNQPVKAFDVRIKSYWPDANSGEQWFLEHHLFRHREIKDAMSDTLSDYRNPEKNVLIGGLGYEQYGFKKWSHRPLDIFKLLASKDEIALLKTTSAATADRIIDEMIANLPVTATRGALIKALQDRFNFEHHKAVTVVNSLDTSRVGTRFDYNPKDPVWGAFREIAANANDTHMFWFSLHGELWKAGYEFKTPFIRDFRDFVDDHVPPGAQQDMLNSVSEEQFKDRQAKKSGGRMLNKSGNPLNERSKMLDTRNLSLEIRALFEQETKRPERQFVTPKPSAAVPATQPNEPAPKSSLFSGIAVKSRKLKAG